MNMSLQLATIGPVITMLNSILRLVLLLYPLMVLCNGRFVRIALPPGATGPDAVAFDKEDEGPFTGVADGRILKFEAHTGFVDYGSSSPNRSEALCNGNTNIGRIKQCGQPLGLEFYYKTGDLYVCDAAFGLVVVPPYGGPAAQVVTQAEGSPINFAATVAVDQRTCVVYFTDASSRYNLSQINEVVAANDSTGRLIKYDPKTRIATVLLKGLAGPAGVVVTRNGDFLLVNKLGKGDRKHLYTI